MFLAAATTVDEILTHGVEPCIELMDMVQDFMDDGEEEKAIILMTQIKGALLQIKSRLKKIKSTQKNTM